MGDPRSLRILFAGTPDFSVPPLESLIEAGFKPVAVYTQPDRPAGRGRKMQPGPVKQTALEHGIDVFQPISLKPAEAQQQLGELQPDLMVVVAYGLILPQSVLDIPLHGCWNIHASLLPRWRGAAPIQRAIEAGDRESGICIMQMEAGLDTGPVLHEVRIPIETDETGGSLHDKLAVTGAEALMDCVRRLAAGDPPPARPQPDQGTSYAHKLDKAEARIDWNAPALELERRIRAFNPWPVTWCMVGGERTRIWSGKCQPGSSEWSPGTVLDSGKEGIDVACGKGILRLTELQRPGKRRMPAFEYLNAGNLPDVLG